MAKKPKTQEKDPNPVVEISFISATVGRMNVSEQQLKAEAMEQLMKKLPISFHVKRYHNGATVTASIVIVKQQKKILVG